MSVSYCYSVTVWQLHMDTFYLSAQYHARKTLAKMLVTILANTSHHKQHCHHSHSFCCISLQFQPYHKSEVCANTYSSRRFYWLHFCSAHSHSWSFYSAFLVEFCLLQNGATLSPTLRLHISAITLSFSLLLFFLDKRITRAFVWCITRH